MSTVEVSEQRQAYSKYISSQAWKEKRSQVLQRDEYRCRICGFSDADGLNLQVHHSSYENLGDEPLNQLITVCTYCHPIADQCQKRQRQRLGQNNQVRVNPGAFLTEVESSEPVVIEKENANTEVDSSINRSVTNIDAFGTNRRSAESLLEGIESYIE